jgi:hypothetical protein
MKHMKKKLVLFFCIFFIFGCFSCTCSKSEKEAAEPEKPSAVEIAKREAEKKAAIKEELQEIFSQEQEKFDSTEEWLAYMEKRAERMDDALKYMENDHTVTWEEAGLSESRARSIHKSFSDAISTQKNTLKRELTQAVKRWRELRPYADEKEQIETRIAEALSDRFDPNELNITEEEKEYIAERH